MCRGNYKKSRVMGKRKLLVLIISSVLIIGLLIWNNYLMNEMEQLRKENSDLQLKNQMLEGENDIISYDLVTTRDSLRILNLKQQE